MKLRNNLEQYGAIAKIFHWAVAVAVLTLLAVGYIMTDMQLSSDKVRLYGIHKAVGALVLITVFLRLFWRWINPVPALPVDMPRWQKAAAHLSHIALYLVLFAMPLSGWLMSSAAGLPVSVFGWFALPNLIAPDKVLRGFFAEFHETLAVVVIALVSLHVLAALKHHFINKDTVLRRMLPFLCLLFLLPHAAVAQKAELRKWYLVGDQSNLTFTAVQNNAPVTGAFNAFRTVIYFSPENLAESSINVQVEMDSIHMDYPEAEKAVRSRDWLDVKRYLVANFVSTKIIHQAKNNYVMEGDLTMHGHKLPVILHFTLEEYGETHARVKGEATLSRTAFEVGSGEWAATDLVKDEVKVAFTIVAQNTPWSPPIMQ